MHEFWNKVLINFQGGSVLTVGLVITAIVILLVGLVLSSWFTRLLGRRLERARVNADTRAAIQKLLFIFLMVGISLTALGVLQVPLTAFTFLSGAVAIGIGFGAQNIINNFISGWILMSERPLRIGDFVEIDESRGVVERIGNRSTRIRRVDGVHIMVPNSLLMERTVINWTLVVNNIRTSVTVGVAYGSPVREVERIFTQALEEHESILKEPPIAIMFSDFGDSALLFEGMFWCKAGGERELRVIRSDIRYRLDELFREHNIVIAFPQRDLHIKSLAPVEISTPNQDKTEHG